MRSARPARFNLSLSKQQRPTRLRSGDVVAGKYTIEQLVGQGASGEVWAARETATGERFALKVLATEAATDEETVERFRREAYFLRRTQSVHVARIHDFVFDATTGMALVMELVEGEPLDRALEQRTLSVEEAIELGVDLLAGVAVLHGARVIHRDLKPGNILLREQEGGRLCPVICDFGLSRLARRRDGDASSPSLTELTKGDVAMGTLRYMAPEQVLNARQATEQSDLYAVGAILYRAVTGVPAFGEHDEPRAIARAKVMGEAPRFDTGRTDVVAQAFEKIVTQAIRRRPADRFRSATEMREELARASQLAVPEPEPERTERTSLPDVLEVPATERALPATPAKRPLWRAAAVVGVLLVFAGGVATGRVWTLGSLPGPAPMALAPAATHTPPPGIEAPEVLPDIAELSMPSPPPPAGHLGGPRGHGRRPPAPSTPNGPDGGAGRGRQSLLILGRSDALAPSQPCGKHGPQCGLTSEDSRLSRCVQRTDAAAIEITQRQLLGFASEVAAGRMDSRTLVTEVARHGALLGEIVARRLGGDWVDVSGDHPGLWKMAVPPRTVFTPIGRVHRFLVKRNREQDLVGFFLDLHAASRQGH